MLNKSLFVACLFCSTLANAGVTIDKLPIKIQGEDNAIAHAALVTVYYNVGDKIDCNGLKDKIHSHGLRVLPSAAKSQWEANWNDSEKRETYFEYTILKQDLKLDLDLRVPIKALNAVTGDTINYKLKRCALSMFTLETDGIL